MKATLQAVLLFIVLVAFWACEEEPQIARVSLSPPSAVIHKGETLQFTARVSDDNGDVVTNAHVIWSSDDEAVATIDDDGLATGVSQGSATITATADGAWGSASLTVELTAEQWLAGSWISTDREQKLILTTRSDQDGFDLFSEGDGAIDVTGGQTAELTFLFGLSEEESGGFFIATSSSLSRWFQEGGAPPHPALILEDDPPARPAMIFMGATLAGDTVTYAASPVNYAYDETAGSLAIPESVLYSVDGLDSVVISGTLAYARIQIPANTPTDFDFPILNLEGEAMSVSFGEEGAFTRTSIVIAEGGIETESAEGTWEIQTDSTLTVIETSLDGEPLERPDTLLITFYAISPDTASVSFIEDLCREPDLYGTDEECIAEMERLFGLGSGSLVSVQLSKTILMARGRGRVAARSPGLHWGGTPPGERHLLKMVRNRLSVLFR